MSEFLKRFSIEAFVVGFVFGVIGLFVTLPWSKMHRMSSIFGIFFISGILGHVLFEITGGNRWFCNNSISCAKNIKPIKEAVAVLKGEPGLEATVKVTELDGGSEIEVTGSGLKPGLHGFHIHNKGDLTKGCDSLCSHYNPHGKNHGGPDDEDRHLGDLGNIEVKNNGKIISNKVFYKDIYLNGDYSIIGRSFIIHEDKDDLGKYDGDDPTKKEESLKTGNAGKRILCGVIGIAGDC